MFCLSSSLKELHTAAEKSFPRKLKVSTRSTLPRAKYAMENLAITRMQVCPFCVMEPDHSKPISAKHATPIEARIRGNMGPPHVPREN